MNTRRFLLAFLLVTSAARAEIPGDYKPFVIEPPYSYVASVVDLTRAFELAKKSGKKLFIHCGYYAHPAELQYAHFLDAYREELKPAYGQYLLVDVRIRPKERNFVFKINEKRYPLKEFKQLIGDADPDFALPYFWMLSPDGKMVRQLSQKPWDYLSLKTHLRQLEP